MFMILFFFLSFPPLLSWPFCIPPNWDIFSNIDYAKLVRKKDKNAANGETVAIDMDTLRASARAAEVADKSARASKPQQQQRSSHQSDSTASPGDVKPLPPQQYQTTFQLASMITTANPTPNPSSSTGAGASAPSQQQQQQDQNQNQGTPSSSASSITPGAGENGSGKQGQQQQQQHNASMPPPTSLPPQPPWVTPPVIPSSRPIYPAPDHLQHQSFMRGSHGGPSR